MSAGVSAREFYIVEELGDYDFYDVLADIGYGVAPRTKRDRAIAFSLRCGRGLKREFLKREQVKEYESSIETKSRC